MRRHGLTTIFGNPGSTEISFLTDLPQDISFVLGLHEGSVVGMATGYAIARGRPAFVNLHTAPGLGNAINAIANARDCRAPLVIVVGQQDRRQLALEPFLTGRHLDRLAGEYPVWTNLPGRAQDVPGAIARAFHEAQSAAGPALVVVPMGDWLEPADEEGPAAPASVLRARSVLPEEVAGVADLIADARSPAFVVGPGADSREGWDAVVALAERLRCPVWQEPFARRAGFPQDHPLFSGHLPWRRRLMRDTLAPHDLVLAIGTGAFRLYLLEEPGPPVRPGTRVAVITEDPAEAHRSRCEVAIVAPVAPACAALAQLVPGRDGAAPAPMARLEPPPPPAPGERLAPGHVLAALAERLPADAVIVEETPSSQPELYQRIAIRAPLGFVGTANGGLGFGLAGSIGLRMGFPDRPVIGVIGDGSSLYAIQSLWSAAHYGVGVLVIVMANGRYAVMDALAHATGAPGPWPGFETVDIAGLARSLGCPAVRVETHAELISTLDEVLPGLVDRREPLVAVVAVE
jgi:benzoylformate decarboxylase